MKSLEEIAYHEAGHCCIALALGHRPLSATVDRDGDSLGSYHVQLKSRQSLDLAHHRLLIALGGPLAQAMFRYGQDKIFIDMLPDPREGGDYRQAVEFAVLHHPNGIDAVPEEITVIMRAASMECQTLLRTPTMWRSVSRLAQALQTHRTVTAESIQRIINAPQLIA